MKKSILKSTALVLCAGLVCCLLLTAAIFDAKTTQQTETQLRSLATALGSAYDANGDADAQASQFSRQIGGLRVTVIAKDGTVLGDSAADYKTMENHAGREELKAAEGAGVGISVRPSETLGTRLMYAAVRTQGGDYIRVAMQYNGFFAGPCKPAARVAGRRSGRFCSGGVRGHARGKNRDGPYFRFYRKPEKRAGGRRTVGAGEIPL